MTADDQSKDQVKQNGEPPMEIESGETLDFTQPGRSVNAQSDIESQAEVADGTIDETLEARGSKDRGQEFTTTAGLAPPETSAASHNVSSPGTQTGHSFGDYELLEEIGRGGMGVVYKARQISLDRTVALKMVLSAEHASEEEARRFRVEAEAVAKLDHPGIVPVFEVGTRDGRLFYSMGFIAGTSLAERIHEEPLPPREAAALVSKIADAIAHAHSQHIIHRDLKPANILLDKADEPRVTDFGLAKRLDVESDLTMSGQVMGTPSYMAPEQAAGRADEIGPLADVYALGAILYATLTGRPPFRAAGLHETLRQVINDDPVPPRRLNSAIDRDLENICLKCLHKQPEQRYASAGELAEEFRRYLRGEPVQARPVTQLERVRRWCWRNPVVSSLGMATLLLLVCLAIGGPLLSLSERSARQRATEETAAANTARQAADTAKEQAEAQRKRAVGSQQEAETARAQALEDASRATRAAYNARVSNLAARVDTDPDLVSLVAHSSLCPEPLRDFTWRYLSRANLRYTSTSWMQAGNTFAADLAFSPDGQYIASAGDANVKILKYHEHYPHGDYPHGDEMELVHELDVGGPVSWSPDGLKLFAGLTAFDAASGEVVLTAEEAVKQATTEGDEVASARFSPDGKWIVATISGKSYRNRLVI